jgi:uncharacterized protein YndB with AHSA1/START domain
MPKKQSREQVVIEYPINCSPSILFNYISNASGLQEWFAHKVTTKSRTDFVFQFDDGEETKATLLKSVNNKLSRFKWENTADEEFMELEIIVDELTEDVAIKVTEFCNTDEKREIEELWHSQFETLRDVVGA